MPRKGEQDAPSAQNCSRRIEPHFGFRLEKGFVVQRRDGALYHDNCGGLCLAPYVRYLADEARALFKNVAPFTRHWVTLDTLIAQFGEEFLFTNVGELKQLLGSRKYADFIRVNMGAVQFKYGGSKQFFLPGAMANYALKDLMLFLGSLPGAVDVRLLMACHSNTAAAVELVQQNGGSAGVGDLLAPFRQDVEDFASAHSVVLYGAVCEAGADGEARVVETVKELAACGVLSSLDTTLFLFRPLAWVNRTAEDPNQALEPKMRSALVADHAQPPTPCALALSPPGRTLAPACPPFLVDCDAAIFAKAKASEARKEHRLDGEAGAEERGMVDCSSSSSSSSGGGGGDSSSGSSIMTKQEVGFGKEG